MCQFFRRKLAKIAENWRKSPKIVENRRKSTKIVENRRKSSKIVENCYHNIDPRALDGIAQKCLRLVVRSAAAKLHPSELSKKLSTFAHKSIVYLPTDGTLDPGKPAAVGRTTMNEIFF
jgi:hypothetical protein